MRPRQQSGVALEGEPGGAAQGAAAHQAAVGGAAKAEEVEQGELSEGSRRELSVRCARTRIEGADLLTSIAAKYPGLQPGEQLLGQQAGLFYGEAGDAAAGVEQAGLEQRAGRAGVEAEPAATAALALAWVRRQLEGGEQHPDAGVRAEPRRDEKSVLANETKAGSRRQLPLEEREAVNRHQERLLRQSGLLDQAQQSPSQHQVVIGTARKAGHLAGRAGARSGLGASPLTVAVVGKDHDGGARRGEQGSGVAPPLEVAAQVAKLTAQAGLHPGAQEIQMRKLVGDRGKADSSKAQGLTDLADPLAGGQAHLGQARVWPSSPWGSRPARMAEAVAAVG